MNEQELRERVAVFLAENYHPHQDYTDLANGIKADLEYFSDCILTIIKEAGYTRQPHWNCPENCKHKMTTSQGSWDNSKIGGCYIGYKLPENIVLDIDNALPICPFYRPEPPADKAKLIADKLWQDIQDCEGEIQRGQVDVMAREILALFPEPELERLMEIELGEIVLHVAVRDQWCVRGEDLTGWMPAFKTIAQAQLDKDREAIKERR